MAVWPGDSDPGLPPWSAYSRTDRAKGRLAQSRFCELREERRGAPDQEGYQGQRIWGVRLSQRPRVRGVGSLSGSVFSRETSRVPTEDRRRCRLAARDAIHAVGPASLLERRVEL